MGLFKAQTYKETWNFGSKFNLFLYPSTKQPMLDFWSQLPSLSFFLALTHGSTQGIFTTTSVLYLWLFEVWRICVEDMNMETLSLGSVPRVMSEPIIIRIIVLSSNILHVSSSPSTPRIMRHYGLIIQLNSLKMTKWTINLPYVESRTPLHSATSKQLRSEVSDICLRTFVGLIGFPLVWKSWKFIVSDHPSMCYFCVFCKWVRAVNWWKYQHILKSNQYSLEYLFTHLMINIGYPWVGCHNHCWANPKMVWCVMIMNLTKDAYF